MTAEDLDALAADVGREQVSHADCTADFCEGRVALELARGYLSLRLVQADHERQIAALRETRDVSFEAMQRADDTLVEQSARIAELESQKSALQAAYDDVQKAYLRVCGEPTIAAAVREKFFHDNTHPRMG